ncbi:MAG: hypothetical protein COA66_05205 [Arcobacter sp.]|nr:MAG: hypothetical protein COA66_05205 [Arcobacter sp.]
MKILIILCILLQYYIFANNINIEAPKSKYDTNHKYYYNLIQKILKITEKEYGKSHLQYNRVYEQRRMFVNLKKNKEINLVWAGVSLERDRDFLSVKIPLTKGLLGYRIFIINKKNSKIFDAIENIKDLKKLKACQAVHWPDTDVLKYAGLNVLENTNYERMFLQVLKGRCDYFPRGVGEAYREVEVRKQIYNDLIVYKKIILYYPFPMYFFFNKNNQGLKDRIEKGLRIMIENGSFDNYLKTSKNTKNLFPLDKWMNVKIFKLKNPYLPKDSDINNEKLWILPKD